jgi:hypothetical protein
VGKVKKWVRLHLRYQQTRSGTNVSLLLVLGLVLAYSGVREYYSQNRRFCLLLVKFLSALSMGGSVGI